AANLAPVAQWASGARRDRVAPRMPRDRGPGNGTAGSRAIEVPGGSAGRGDRSALQPDPARCLEPLETGARISAPDARPHTRSPRPACSWRPGPGDAVCVPGAATAQELNPADTSPRTRGGA